MSVHCVHARPKEARKGFVSSRTEVKDTCELHMGAGNGTQVLLQEQQVF